MDMVADMVLIIYPTDTNYLTFFTDYPRFSNTIN
jgi:hypothetical protein